MRCDYFSYRRSCAAAALSRCRLVVIGTFAIKSPARIVNDVRGTVADGVKVVVDDDLALMLLLLS